MTKTKPSLIDAASWMALPIGIMWAASFFCTMYGYDRPALSMLSSALGVFSIFVLYIGRFEYELYQLKKLSHEE